jgi:hypothetical protein
MQTGKIIAFESQMQKLRLRKITYDLTRAIDLIHPLVKRSKSLGRIQDLEDFGSSYLEDFESSEYLFYKDVERVLQSRRTVIKLNVRTMKDLSFYGDSPEIKEGRLPLSWGNEPSCGCFLINSSGVG